MPFDTLFGILAGFLIMLWGAYEFFRPLINELRFRLFYLRDVRRLWSQHVKPGQDIIAITGADVWWECFEAGKTPEEAVFE